MAWYDGTYRCGHTGSVQIVGPGRDREWKRQRAFSSICPECYKKYLAEKREQENAESAEISKEMELPELTGSPKQIAWANTLRIKFLEKYDDFLKDFRFSGKERKKIITEEFTLIITEDKLIQSQDWLITRKTDAKFWIDSRFEYPPYFIKAAYDGIEEESLAIPDEVQEEINMEEAKLTVQPKTPLKNGVVKISVSNDVIYAKYVKDSDFMEIVKSLKYQWKGVWAKNITEYTGSSDDRIAELGNKLLSHGFTVQFPTESSKALAVSGSFTPECTRWIRYGKEKKKLYILWGEKNNDLYQSSKKLPGAKWNSGAMLVSPEFYMEVIDFAETWGFQISKAAQEAINAYKEKESCFNKEDISEPISEEIDGSSNLKRQLEKAGIIEDLRDEA